MSTRKERAFAAKVNQLIRQSGRLDMAAVERVLRLLNETRREVLATMAEAEWKAHRVQEINRAVDRSLAEFGRKYKIDVSGHLSSSWDLGVEMVDAPLAAVGINTARMTHIDSTLLGVMQDYSADLVTNVTQDTIAAINREISLSLLGGKTPYEAMRGIGQNLKDPSVFKTIAQRSEIILRTEGNRALSMAAEARLQSAAEVVPALKKEWRHSPRAKHPRQTHLAASGQRVSVKAKFLVGGEALQYPRDPAGSKGNTINCGCYVLPYHDDWEEAVKAAA